VVGGGNSAATGAMTLAEAGANVTVATRRPPAEFQSHLRPFIVRDLRIMADEKRLNIITHVSLTAITPTSVTLAPYLPYCENDDQRNCAPLTLPNDFVFALLGHTADTDLFAHLGAPLADDGLPIYDETTAETPVLGLYVAGALSRANIILESRRRAVEIVTRIASILAR
jgi:thioredoxin reductase